MIRFPHSAQFRQFMIGWINNLIAIGWTIAFYDQQLISA